QNMEVSSSSNENSENFRMPQTSNAHDCNVKNKIVNEKDSTTAEASKTQESQFHNSDRLPKVNSVLDAKCEIEEIFTNPKVKENSKFGKKSLIDTMKFKLCFESKDKKKPDMIKPSMLKRPSNKSKGEANDSFQGSDTLGTFVSKKKFKENPSIDVQNILSVSRHSRNELKKSKNAVDKDLECPKNDSSNHSESKLKKDKSEKNNRERSKLTDVCATNDKKISPLKSNNNYGNNEEVSKVNTDQVKPSINHTKVSDGESIKQDQEIKGKKLIKNYLVQDNVNSKHTTNHKVDSKCKVRCSLEDKSPSTDIASKDMSPCHSPKGPILHDNSPSYDGTPSANRFPTHDDRLIKNENFKKIFSCDEPTSNERHSQKERTVSKTTKKNFTLLHKNLTKDRICKKISRHRYKVLRSKIGDKTCNLSASSKKFYSKSRFYRFKARFTKGSMSYRFKARFNKKSMSLKTRKLLRKLNIRNSLMKDQKKSGNKKTASTGHEKKSAKLMEPEIESKIKPLDKETRFYSGPESPPIENTSVNYDNDQIDQILEITSGNKSYDDVNSCSKEMSMKRKSDFNSDFCNKKCKSEPEDTLTNNSKSPTATMIAEIYNRVSDLVQSIADSDNRGIQHIPELPSILPQSKKCHEMENSHNHSESNTRPGDECLEITKISSHKQHEKMNKNTIENVEDIENNNFKSKSCTGSQPDLEKMVSIQMVNNNSMNTNVTSSHTLLRTKLDLNKNCLKDKVPTPGNVINTKTQMLPVDSEGSSDSFKSVTFETNSTYLTNSVTDTPESISPSHLEGKEEEIEENLGNNVLGMIDMDISPTDTPEIVIPSHIEGKGEKIEENLVNHVSGIIDMDISPPDTPQIIIPSHIEEKEMEIEENLVNNVSGMNDMDICLDISKMNNLDNSPDISEIIVVPTSENPQSECFDNKHDIKVIDKVFKKINSSSVTILTDTVRNKPVLLKFPEDIKKWNRKNNAQVNEVKHSDHNELKSDGEEISQSKENLDSKSEFSSKEKNDTDNLKSIKFPGTETDQHCKGTNVSKICLKNKISPKTKNDLEEDQSFNHEDATKGSSCMANEFVFKVDDTKLVSKIDNTELVSNIDTEVLSKINDPTLAVFGTDPEADLRDILSNWTTCGLEGLNFLSDTIKDMTSKKSLDILPSKSLNITMESLISEQFLNLEMNEIDTIIYKEILKMDSDSMQRYDKKLNEVSNKNHGNLELLSELQHIHIKAEDKENNKKKCRVCSTTSKSKNILTLPDNTTPYWFDGSFNVNKIDKHTLKMKKWIHIYNAKEEDAKKLK
ncbi:unnamed protein product, partial [Meganyctiphanes norvegica]